MYCMCRSSSKPRVGGNSGALSHSQAVQVFQDSSVDPDDDSETGSDEDTTHTLTNPLETEVSVYSMYTTPERLCMQHVYNLLVIMFMSFQFHVVVFLLYKHLVYMYISQCLCIHM